MRSRFTRTNLASLVLGLAFLYLPIAILVGYSFNASRLVTVWGGFSTRWYAGLWQNGPLMQSAWISLKVALLSATAATVVGNRAGAGADAPRPLPGPGAARLPRFSHRW